MMHNIQIRVNDETVNYMERLSFELEGSKRIIKEILTDPITPTEVLDGEVFKKYNARYEEKFASYELGKRELEKNYIPKILFDNSVNFNWNLDFTTGVMSVNILDDEFDVSKLEGVVNV